MKNGKLSRRAARLLAAFLMLLLCLGLGNRTALADAGVSDHDDPPPLTEQLTDDDGDGIIFYKFCYKGATVYSLIVLDPDRVFVGTALPEPNGWGGNGVTLDDMAEQYGAVAGINAGGFVDEDGAGNGWPPRGITYGRGLCFSDEQCGPIAGLDGSNRLWAGWYTNEDCEAIGIRDAVCFGPTLISDGVPVDPDKLESGIGARTLVGQREDGAVVLVAIDGRQGYSIGVTFADCVALMADKFGCVNASNMDGGNSTCMILNGEAVNRSANKAGGTRYLPDAWLVRPLPEDYVKPANVPDRIILPADALGEHPEYVSECGPEFCEGLTDFVNAFVEAYYGYFGTMNADYYYPTLLQYVAQDCDLRDRVNMALQDRIWVNTWRTDASNLELLGAWLNEDGSYDILIRTDIYEVSTYWSHEAPGTELRITVVEDPDARYGYLATATY